GRAGLGQHVRVAAVEHGDDAGEARGRTPIEPCAAYQKENIGGVRIVGLDGDQNRLARAVAVARLRVRQEGCVVIGPQQAIESFGALGGVAADQRPPAALQGALDEAGKHVLQRAALEMVEQRLAHGGLTAHRVECGTISPNLRVSGSYRTAKFRSSPQSVLSSPTWSALTSSTCLPPSPSPNILMENFSFNCSV